jgi:hypothetical protein
LLQKQFTRRIRRKVYENKQWNEHDVKTDGKYVEKHNCSSLFIVQRQSKQAEQVTFNSHRQRINFRGVVEFKQLNCREKCTQEPIRNSRFHTQFRIIERKSAEQAKLKESL